jgi:hypothetical protein
MLGNSYNDEERVLAAGYDNGDVKLFDLRNMALKWETNVKNGVRRFKHALQIAKLGIRSAPLNLIARTSK